MTPWHLKNNMTPTTKCCCWLAPSKVVGLVREVRLPKEGEWGCHSQWDPATSMTRVYGTRENWGEANVKGMNAPFVSYP